MRNFRLIFKRDGTILERQLKNGQHYSQDLFPDYNERDAKLIDQLYEKACCEHKKRMEVLDELTRLSEGFGYW